MSRPSQIRRVVAELRRALGPEVPVWQLLQLAAAIVEAHRNPEAFDYASPTERPPFFAMDVDTALDDGGWRVLDFECRGGMSIGKETGDTSDRVALRLRHFFGPNGWRRTGMD